jgi:hypothetical protein
LEATDDGSDYDCIVFIRADGDNGCNDSDNAADENEPPSTEDVGETARERKSKRGADGDGAEHPIVVRRRPYVIRLEWRIKASARHVPRASSIDLIMAPTVAPC